jgi:hypothetical protein
VHPVWQARPAWLALVWQVRHQLGKDLAVAHREKPCRPHTRPSDRSEASPPTRPTARPARTWAWARRPMGHIWAHVGQDRLTNYRSKPKRVQKINMNLCKSSNKIHYTLSKCPIKTTKDTHASNKCLQLRNSHSHFRAIIKTRGARRCAGPKNRFHVRASHLYSMLDNNKNGC